MQDPIKRFLLIKYLGIPTDMGLKQAYWRKKNSSYEYKNPDKDHCGIIWLAPVVPFTGDHLSRCTQLILDKVEEYGLQSGVSVINFDERNLYVFASILWDRDSTKEETHALSCYQELTELLESNGYYSYRHNTLKMKQGMDHKRDPLGYFLNTIKKSIDPNLILSPGKYNMG